MLDPMNPLTQGSFLSFAELFWFMVGDKRHAFYPIPILTFLDAYQIFVKAVREVSQCTLSLDLRIAAFYVISILGKELVN